jgi:hypothetical protein
MGVPQFSGTVFANYRYNTGVHGAGYNSFNFERAYLTMKDQLSDRTSLRVTTDIFDPGSSVSGNDGYVVRLKYAYLQYDYLKGSDWSGVARGGMIHNVYIDHEENFWPRWIAKTPADMTGIMPSSDLGVGTILTMPNKFGEIYALVTNGGGYTVTKDADRFKDYSARITLTPLSSSEGLLKSFDLSGWYYKGAVAGTIPSATASPAMDKDRWGIFAGIRDPRLTVGFDYMDSKNESQLTATTDTSISGRLFSGFIVARPFQWINSASTSPLGIVLRYDQIKPNTDLSPSYSVYIAGLTYDLSKKASISLDYQEQSSSNPTTLPVASQALLAAAKGVYMHMLVNF